MLSIYIYKCNNIIWSFKGTWHEWKCQHICTHKWRSRRYLYVFLKLIFPLMRTKQKNNLESYLDVKNALKHWKQKLNSRNTWKFCIPLNIFGRDVDTFDLVIYCWRNWISALKTDFTKLNSYNTTKTWERNIFFKNVNTFECESTPFSSWRQRLPGCEWNQTFQNSVDFGTFNGKIKILVF